ncbi:MAG: hypothetical protein QM648_06475 [Solirubrobacterales bacterium]
MLHQSDLLKSLGRSGLDIDYAKAPNAGGAYKAVAGTAKDRTGRTVVFEVALFPRNTAPTSRSLTYLNTIQGRDPDDLAPDVGTNGNIAYGRLTLRAGRAVHEWTTEMKLDNAVFAAFGPGNPEVTAKFSSP